jgi:ethanolamine transporter EutH
VSEVQQHREVGEGLNPLLSNDIVLFREMEIVSVGSSAAHVVGTICAIGCRGFERRSEDMGTSLNVTAVSATGLIER